MRKQIFLAALCLVATVLSLSAGKLEVKFLEFGLEAGALDTQSPIHLNDDIDLSFEQGGASSAPSFNSSNGQISLTMQSVLKVLGRTADVNITEIVLTSSKRSVTFSAGSAECIPPGTFTIDKDVFTNTWSDPDGANAVQITNTMGAPVIVSIRVTYTGGVSGGDTPDPTPEPEPEPTPGDDATYDDIFATSFDTKDAFDLFTVINVDPKSKTWDFVKSAECARIDNDMGNTITKDDYLVTPALDLKAGSTYRVTFVTWTANDRYPEKIRVVMGSEATAEALTDVIVEETVVNSADVKEITGSFTVPADGSYYLALHAVSDAGMYQLNVDDLVISRGVSPMAPAEISDFTAIPDPDGALKVKLSLTAPAANMAGEPLESLDSVVIRRGTTVVAALEATPGQELIFDDIVETPGSYKYTATAISPQGKSIDAMATIWVGIAVPSSPETLDVEELQPGKLKFTWKQVPTNIHGHLISPSQVRYTIYAGGTTRVLAEDLSGGEAIVDYPSPGMPQDITYFTLKASTSAGTSAKAAETPVIAVGTPYSMPYVENFPDGLLTPGQVAEIIPDPETPVARWGYFEQMVANDVIPVAPDGGMLVFTPYGAGNTSTFRTGKIAVEADAANPFFSFYYYAMPDAEDVLKIAIDNDTVRTLTIGADQRGWKEVMLPLDSYKGEVVRISLTAYCSDRNINICVDNLAVKDFLLEDLALSRVRIPYEMKPATDHKCSIRVENNGVNTSADFKLTVSSGENLLWSGSGSALERGATRDFEFTVNPDFDQSGEVAFDVVLEYTADENQENNSATVSSQVTGINLPAVENITATSTSDGYLITWDDINAGTLPVRRVTEGFESYDEFATAGAGEWTFVDGDGCNVLGIRDGYHSYPGMFEPMAFMVFNNHDGYFPQIGTSSFAPYEGGQCLISASVDCLNSTDCSNDDWLISPLLSGNAQTVSFFARSSGMVFPENIKVMASSTDNMISSFTEVASYEKLSSKWTEFTVDLPAGSRYFAIRNVSYDQYILFVDNISFEAAPLDVTVEGYDVYMGSDDEWTLLTEQPVAEPAVTVGSLQSEKSLKVAARYSNGYVAMSEPVMVSVASADIIGADSADAEYFDLRGIRLGAFPTIPGIYIERRGDVTRKIAIVR